MALSVNVRGSLPLPQRRWAALVGHFNLFELPGGLVARIEHEEIDELVSVWLLVGVAFLFDQVRFTRRVHNIATLEAERLRVVHVTMRTVQDIVNDGLNQLQLLRFDAEDHVPPESLALFDDAIRDTVAPLGNVVADVPEGEPSTAPRSRTLALFAVFGVGISLGLSGYGGTRWSATWEGTMGRRPAPGRLTCRLASLPIRLVLALRACFPSALATSCLVRDQPLTPKVVRRRWPATRSGRS